MKGRDKTSPPRRGRMPLIAATSEACRNLCTGTTRALAFALVLSFWLGVLIWADVGSATSATEKARAYVAAGASTHTIVSESNIDAKACERLVSSGFVDAAGAIRAGQDVRLRVMPSNPVPTYEATPGLLQLIGPDRGHPDSSGVYLSPQLAEMLAPSLGQPKASTSAAHPVAVPPVTALGTYPWPDDGRPTPLQYALVGATPPSGVFDQCWVRSSNPTTDPSFLLRSTLIRAPTDLGSVEVAQLNLRLGASLTAADDFDQRATRLAWVGGIFFAGLLAAASLWLRRLELANAKEVGVPLLAQLTATAIETCVWALAGAALAVPVLLIRAKQGPALDQSDLIIVGVPILLSGLAGSVIGALVATSLLRRQAVTDYLRTR